MDQAASPAPNKIRGLASPRRLCNAMALILTEGERGAGPEGWLAEPPSREEQLSRRIARSHMGTIRESRQATQRIRNSIPVTPFGRSEKFSHLTGNSILRNLE